MTLRGTGAGCPSWLQGTSTSTWDRQHSSQGCSTPRKRARSRCLLCSPEAVHQRVQLQLQASSVPPMRCLSMHASMSLQSLLPQVQGFVNSLSITCACRHQAGSYIQRHAAKATGSTGSTSRAAVKAPAGSHIKQHPDKGTNCCCHCSSGYASSLWCRCQSAQASFCCSSCPGRQADLAAQLCLELSTAMHGSAEAMSKMRWSHHQESR